MNLGFAFIVGVVIWVPSVFLLGGSSLGPAIKGIELFMAGAPVAFIAGPWLWRSSKTENLVAAVWAIAIAPLLAIAGLITSSIASKLVFGQIFYPSKDLHGALVSAAGWAAVGALLHLAHRQRPDTSTSGHEREKPVKTLRGPSRW